MYVFVRENPAPMHSAKCNKIERVSIALEYELQPRWPIKAAHRAGVVAAVPGGKRLNILSTYGSCTMRPRTGATTHHKIHHLHGQSRTER
jgi:hypothetical protein